MDPGFVNDSTIYYNLPPLLEKKDGNRRSTLPRPHSSFICERSSSCPTSPKLSIFRPKTKPIEPPFGIDNDTGTKPSNEGCISNGRSKPLPLDTESEPLYQNAGISNVKSRKKTLFFPWWKRKRPEPDVQTSTGVSQSTGGGTETIPAKEELADGIFESPDGDRTSSRHSAGSQNFVPSNYLAIPTPSSSCSSSTTLNDDEDSSYSCERVVGGVSYVKPAKTSQRGFNRNTNSALKPAGSAATVDFSHRISHWVREWRRKSRWLSRRRRERNPRHNGEGDVDIALVHYGRDTTMWVDYLHDSFSLLLQDTLGCAQARIEKINMESFADYHQIPEVQASRLQDAKLQIVIISPGLLKFLHSESEFQIGKLLRPKRVLSLLLGITRQTVKNDSVASSTLYSFDEWTSLEVRDRDEAFVAQVQEQGLRLLNHCDVFDQCKASSAFSLCPRKITQSYCKVYIHLKSSIPNPHERQIHVTVGQSSSVQTEPIPQVQCHNPFTLSFNMPEKMLGMSCFLKVNLHVDGCFVGSREVKCEGPSEIMRDLLKSAVDPTELMCQALGINPVSDELDKKLAQRIKRNLPLATDFNIDDKPADVLSKLELPTWLHFSAFYGLQNFSWALLDIPFGEIALLIKNSKGYTPAKLALQAGYSKLAQDLENVSIVTKLAHKAKGKSQSSGEDLSVEEYSPVPRPRPYTPRADLPNYDTPPQPRSIWDELPSAPVECSRSNNQTTTSNSPSLSAGSDTHYANLIHESSSISSGGESLSAKPNLNSTPLDETEQEYLDMSGMKLQFEEYQKDVSTLIDAWDKRNDARTFLSQFQHTISKLKKNFNFKTQNLEETPPLARSQCVVDQPDEAITKDISSSSEDDD